jgi:hypothetical protein
LYKTRIAASENPVYQVLRRLKSGALPEPIWFCHAH